MTNPSNNPAGRPPKYSADEIEHGLAAMVHFGGDAGKARDYLQSEHGIAVPAATLRYWKTSSHVRRYHEIAELRGREYDSRAIQRFKELEAAANETAFAAVNAAKDALVNNQLEPREYGKLAQQMAIAAGVASDKRLVIEGKPTVITQNKSAEELYGALSRLGQIVEGTVEEVEPEQIPSVVRTPASRNP